VSYGFNWNTCSLNLDHSVRREQRVAAGEPFFDLELRRVVAAGAVVVECADVPELRERTQQLRSWDRLRVEGASQQQAPEWIRNAGFEWLYRLTKDFRRLWIRYTLYNAVFLAMFTLQLMGIRRFDSSDLIDNHDLTLKHEGPTLSGD